MIIKMNIDTLKRLPRLLLPATNTCTMLIHPVSIIYNAHAMSLSYSKEERESE